MKRSSEEQAQTERLEEQYVQLQSPVMLSIESRVCGCNYGGNSWTTRDKANEISSLLGLRRGTRLLDVGSGSGWPGLYMAQRSGCNVTLVDLPISGLRIATDRAATDQITGIFWAICADAAKMPFSDASFDALSHSDLLCCLREKRTVLESCNRVIRQGGRMVFTVISATADLSPDERTRVLGAAPEFVESETEYSTLLQQTGWEVIENRDISLDYASSCQRQIQAEKENRDNLIAVIGASEYKERQARWESKLSVLDDRLLRRELFVATTA